MSATAQAMTRTKNNHNTKVFKNIREALVSNAAIGNSSASFDLTTTSSGTIDQQTPLAPLGVSGPQLVSAASGSAVTINTASIESPHLPWLYNTARNFERYRVTRANLVFVGNVGSTSTGRIIMDSTTDYADMLTTSTIANTSGGKGWALASAANKDLRFQMDIDNSWKRVSAYTHNTIAAATGYLDIMSSVNDLLFSCLVIVVTGAAASTNIGTVFIEYDVEFKDPITWSANV